MGINTSFRRHGVDAFTGVCGPHKVAQNRWVLQFTTGTP